MDETIGEGFTLDICDSSDIDNPDMFRLLSGPTPDPEETPAALEKDSSEEK